MVILPDSITPNELCGYTLLEHNIHQFTLVQGSHAAADQYFDKVMRVFEEAARQSPGQLVLILNDFNNLTLGPRMPYLFQKSKEVSTKHPASVRGRVAILTPPSFIVSLAQMFIDLLPKSSGDQVRLFVGDKRAEAIEWLLRDL
jgi:hypothetical protein